MIINHCIIVKWNEEVLNKQELIKKIDVLFSNSMKLEGVHSYKLVPNVIDRSNRYDLAIVIEMEENTLPIYDESSFHHEWKEKYSKFIASKAIFDFKCGE